MKFTPKHIPYTLPWDNMPIDLSFIYQQEKPAGKHGFMTVKGDKFVFEDGTQAKFWGTNFNSGANFPSHEHSEKVAKRLAKIGINIVRLHQLDAEWSTPNIFQFSRGKLLENTLEFDQESMERLDYLIYCLKKEGIYIYMDLLTYRKFKSGDGVPNAELLNEAAKPYSNYSRVLIELQKKFNNDLMTHFNKYTGLAYKDDPAIVLSELANENELFFVDRYPIEVEPYKTELMDMFCRYAKDKGVTFNSNEIDFNKPDAFTLEFLCKVQMDYYKEMIEHLRSIGVKTPIAGTNWSITNALTYCQTVTDFSDLHAYWWKGDQRTFMNDSMLDSENNILPELVALRLINKPVFISEWDQPWPNEWRAEASIFLSAIGALQGWSGFTIHTYRYGTNEREAITEKIGRKLVLGNSYYRGIFDTYNDPAKFGLFYHAALIMRRGDVKEANKEYAVKIDSKNYDQMSKKVGKIDTTAIKPLILGPEKHKVCMDFSDGLTENTIPVSPDEYIVDIKEREVLSDTGEIYRNLDKRIGWIDTELTKVIYGFLGEAGEVEISDLRVKADNDFAVIAISSLNDDVIADSGNMLLTAIGRADNTESEYGGSHTVQLEQGKAPIMIEVIESEIELKTSRKKLSVWSVDSEGFLTGTIPSVYEDGVIKFTIGKEFESMYYLIQEQ